MSLAHIRQLFSVEVLQTAVDTWNEEGIKTAYEAQLPNFQLPSVEELKLLQAAIDTRDKRVA